ncbi:release factor glutamine methyltransferase [Nitratiruptor sp. YY09-18]|nr:release factor glutamine methyltransferase [Nitratiruptor sp. YY09-18]
MKIDEALKLGAKRLKEVARRPLFESELLLAHSLGKDRIYLHAHPEEIVQSKKYWEFIERRSHGEPVEYITKRVSFYGEEFFIDYGALIPRPETELLIENLQPLLQGDEKIAEIGTGSGVIVIMLKKLFPHIEIIATDISKEALAIAQKNAALHDVAIEFVHTSFLDGINSPIDVIVSNPPYIANDYPLQESVRDFEPQSALFGGERGDEILQRIIDTFFFKDAKILACEMGYDQREYIEEYVTAKEADVALTFYKDYANLDRGFIIRKKNG